MYVALIRISFHYHLVILYPATFTGVRQKLFSYSVMNKLYNYCVKWYQCSKFITWISNCFNHWVWHRKTSSRGTNQSAGEKINYWNKFVNSKLDKWSRTRTCWVTEVSTINYFYISEIFLLLLGQNEMIFI